MQELLVAQTVNKSAGIKKPAVLVAKPPLIRPVVVLPREVVKNVAVKKDEGEAGALVAALATAEINKKTEQAEKEKDQSPINLEQKEEVIEKKKDESPRVLPALHTEEGKAVNSFPISDPEIKQEPARSLFPFEENKFANSTFPPMIDTESQILLPPRDEKKPLAPQLDEHKSDVHNSEKSESGHLAFEKREPSPIPQNEIQEKAAEIIEGEVTREMIQKFNKEHPAPPISVPPLRTKGLSKEQMKFVGEPDDLKLLSELRREDGYRSNGKSVYSIPVRNDNWTALQNSYRELRRELELRKRKLYNMNNELNYCIFRTMPQNRHDKRTVAG